MTVSTEQFSPTHQAFELTIRDLLGASMKTIIPIQMIMTLDQNLVKFNLLLFYFACNNSIEFSATKLKPLIGSE